MSSEISIQQGVAASTATAVVEASQKVSKCPAGLARKGMLVAALACGILAAVPPLRIAGMLAARSVAILSNLVNFGETYQQGWLSRILNVARVGLVTLGLVAIVTATPVFLVASLGGDIGLQVIEMGRAIEQGNGLKFAIHFCVMLLDILALAAITTGSWQLMLAAACFGTLAMLTLMGIALNKGMGFEAVCYLGLAALGLVSAVNIGTSVHQLQPSADKQTRHYIVKYWDPHKEYRPPFAWFGSNWKGDWVTYDTTTPPPGAHIDSTYVTHDYSGTFTNSHDYSVTVNGTEVAPGASLAWSSHNSLPEEIPSGAALALTDFGYPTVLGETATSSDL
ncbi:MAG: hypothetical protein KGJ02_06165 [Verrucomicrobiota bacterium]|nr:hypothetical protein [Verrucomicrobiota bacterium]